MNMPSTHHHSADHGGWLHDGAGTRALEAAHQVALPAHTLMQRAGEATARLAVAIAPFASRIHVVCGPGNNGGDGFVAARLLAQWGRNVAVGCVGAGVGAGVGQRRPADAAWALAQAQDAGVALHDFNASKANVQAELTIDALLGLGVSRAPQADMAAAIAYINASATIVLAVDVPSGLHADTGQVVGSAVRAHHTLSLLTLKPGLFTGCGRDHAGQVWLDDLGTPASDTHAVARVGASHTYRQAWPARAHASHKGRFGDLAAVGGERGMSGAAWLAGISALYAGAGRVFVSPLDADAELLLPSHPELMGRAAWWLSPPAVLAQTTVVCGCGGGQAVREALPALLSRVPRLVLDADALNAVALDPMLQTLLTARAERGLATVLTPHPLEAARLLGTSSAEVQGDRLAHAARLAHRFACVIVLKGSGTVIAAPGYLPSINLSGNGKLATAGTGDVLAGWLGGTWCAMGNTYGGGDGDTTGRAFQAACASVWLHGAAADACAAREGLKSPLTATSLIAAMQAVLNC